MKPCYEGLKEIRVDVNKIWRKMLWFRVSIGLLPLILIISWNETLSWRFERNQSWCQWDMKENVKWFGASIGLLPLILIVLWNETLLWRFERNQSWCWWDMKENVKFWSKYRVVTPYFDCLVKWNPVMKVWKKLELMLMRYEGKC